MRNKSVILFFAILIFTKKLTAQCAMCKAVVETNLKEGGSAGAGLNEGILYLMAIPYIAIFIFCLFYALQKNREQQTT